jgi:hypothetical protein
MKLNAIYRSLGGADASVIALFGAARLLKTSAGHYELVGGTAEDRAAAKEWISLFLHEAVPRFRPARPTPPRRLPALPGARVCPAPAD